jgi:iron(III) transport system substrate-binding protein
MKTAALKQIFVMALLDRATQQARVRAPTTLFAAALLAFLVAVPAMAGQNQTVTTAIAGQFTGADRTARLIAGAKREGIVSVYSSTAVEDMAPLVAAFERKYGVRVRVWRGASSDILQRSLTEARAGHHDVDIIETATPEMEALNREGLFETVRSPVFAELMPQAVAPGRPWVASRLIIFNLGYNTNLVRSADLPKSYEDLLQPKWKGRLGIEATDSYWFMTLVSAMGEEKGLKFFRDLVAANGPSARRGHTLLTNLVVSGEVPLALNVYRHEVMELKAAGAPIELLYLPPAIAFQAAIAATKRAPHPHAALLFTDFLLGEGQKIWADKERTPTNLKYQRLPPDLKLTFVDTPKFVNESAKWERLYREILTTRTR